MTHNFDGYEWQIDKDWQAGQCERKARAGIRGGGGARRGDGKRSTQGAPQQPLRHDRERRSGRKC